MLDALLAAYLAGHLATFEEQHPWRADALCREYPDLDWFPGQGDRVDELRAICGRCIVQRECREFAMSAPRLDGFWAGTGQKTRSRLRVAAA